MEEPVHSAEQVLQETGLADCSVSRGYHLGSMLLHPDMPLVWDGMAGVVQFFVEYQRQQHLIFEELREVPSTVRFCRKFFKTGVKRAVILRLISPSLPTWWVFEESTVLVLV